MASAFVRKAVWLKYQKIREAEKWAVEAWQGYDGPYYLVYTTHSAWSKLLWPDA